MKKNMARCLTCGTRYWLSPYNNTNKCDECMDVLDTPYDSDYNADVELLMNPSGKTPVHRYDEVDE